MRACKQKTDAWKNAESLNLLFRIEATMGARNLACKQKNKINK